MTSKFRRYGEAFWVLLPICGRFCFPIFIWELFQLIIRVFIRMPGRRSALLLISIRLILITYAINKTYAGVPGSPLASFLPCKILPPYVLLSTAVRVVRAYRTTWSLFRGVYVRTSILAADDGAASVGASFPPRRRTLSSTLVYFVPLFYCYVRTILPPPLPKWLLLLPLHAAWDVYIAT